MTENNAIVVYRFAKYVSISSALQPTDDIVLMALAVEKVFLKKVAQMPPGEVELNGNKVKARKGSFGRQ